MEYFVDEMPRDCASCKHYHMNCADGYSCSKLRKEIHPNFSEGIGYRHQDCPLQTLADYTKQVRKEVCDKIREWHDEECESLDLDSDFDVGYSGALSNLWGVLDQIEGETKNEETK